MNVQCTSKLQRFNLSLIFTLTIAITAPSVFAKTFDATIDILPLRSDGQLGSFQNKSLRNTNYAASGTQDSDVLPTPAPPVLIAKANLRRQYDKAPGKVIVEQVAEPFMVVGPFTPNSLKGIHRQEPWQVTASLTTPDRNPAHLTPLDLQLQELAQQEPIDIESFGPSVLIPENRSPSVTGIVVAPLNPLIGSSAVIATIEEDYMPYDLSARDLADWNDYPIASHPFNTEDHVTDEQTASLWDDFDLAMALSRSSDPVELNGIAIAQLDLGAAEVNAPSSPSDVTLAPGMPSNTPMYEASRQDKHASAEPISVPVQEDSAITSDEALAILARPESLSLSPAPEHASNPATPKTTNRQSDAEVAEVAKAGPADVALNAILDNLSDVHRFNSIADVKMISSTAGRLLGSYSGSASDWLSKRVADLALNWPTQNQLDLQSRVGAKLLSRASVLESGVVEENTISHYVPVERLDGVDCGSEATMVVADGNGKSQAR